MNRSFRLALLRLRRRELDLARSRFADAVRRRERERLEARRRTAEIHETHDALHRRLARGGPAGFLRAASLAGDVSRGRARDAAQRARAEETGAEAARDAVREAERAVRGLERLEEKAQQRAAALRARREQRQLDEVGGRLWKERRT